MSEPNTIQDTERLVEVTNVQLYHITQKAWKIGPPGLNPMQDRDNPQMVWVPISCLESPDINKIGDIGTITLPAWLAGKKGLIVSA